MEYNMDEYEIMKLKIEKADRLKEQRRNACIKYQNKEENKEKLNAIAKKYYETHLKNNKIYYDTKHEYYKKKKLEKMFPDELPCQI